MRPIADAMCLLILGAAFVALCMASVSDVRNRRIPNWTVLSVAGLFIPWAILGGPDSILSSLAAAFIAFVVSGAMYAFRFLGAGDSKLVTVCALFVGSAHLLQFFVLIALIGGVIAIAILLMQPSRAWVMFQMRGRGRLERGVPYGVAIAVAAICVVGWSQSGGAIVPTLS